LGGVIFDLVRYGYRCDDFLLYSEERECLPLALCLSHLAKLFLAQGGTYLLHQSVITEVVVLTLIGSHYATPC